MKLDSVMVVGSGSVVTIVMLRVKVEAGGVSVIEIVLVSVIVLAGKVVVSEIVICSVVVVGKVVGSTSVVVVIVDSVLSTVIVSLLVIVVKNVVVVVVTNVSGAGVVVVGTNSVVVVGSTRVLMLSSVNVVTSVVTVVLDSVSVNSSVVVVGSVWTGSAHVLGKFWHNIPLLPASESSPWSQWTSAAVWVSSRTWQILSTPILLLPLWLYYLQSQQPPKKSDCWMSSAEQRNARRQGPESSVESYAMVVHGFQFPEGEEHHGKVSIA